MALVNVWFYSKSREKGEHGRHEEGRKASRPLVSSLGAHGGGGGGGGHKGFVKTESSVLSRVVSRSSGVITQPVC